MTSGKTFFSYSRADSEFVLKLAKDLRSAGVDVWLDQLDIPAGKRWDAEIEQALESAQIQLVILSPSSVGSNNVMDEVSYALEKGKHVIPILIKECQIPFRLKRLQYINFTGSYDSGFKELLKALNLDKTKETQKTQNIPVDENIIATNESKVAIEKERNQKLEREAEQKRILQTRQDTTVNSPLNMKKSADSSGMKKSPLKLILVVAAIVILVVVSIIFITSPGPDEEVISNQESQPDQENYSTQGNNPDQLYPEEAYATLESPDDIQVCTGIDEEDNAVGIQNEFYADEEVFVWARVMASKNEDVYFKWVNNTRSIIDGGVWSVDSQRRIISESHTFNEPGICEVILYNSAGEEIGSREFTILDQEQQ